MEQRKTPKADLSRKRGLFLNIGLIMSLILVISAFEWKFYDDLQTVDLGDLDYEEEMLEEIPPIIEATPPPPKVIQDPIIKEVENEEELDEQITMELNVDITDEPVVVTDFPPAPDPKIVEEKIADDPFLVVEEMPEPQNGIEAFYKHLGKKIKYPKQAIRIGREGRVFVQFVVDKDGSLKDIKVIKGIGAGCDEEAIRVLKEAPKWKPGKQRGRKVKVRMSIPITFKLN